MDREPAWTQQALALGQDARQCLGGSLVQHHGGEHEVAGGVGQRGGARVLLAELDVIDAERASARVAIAQERRRDIDGDDLGLRERMAQRQRVVTESAAEVRDALRLEIRVFTLQPCGQRAARGIVPRACHAAHGGEEPRVVVGGVRDIPFNLLGGVATAHQVSVHR